MKKIDDVKVFRFVRLYHNVTLDDISALLGVSKASAHFIEKGEFPLTSERRLKLMNFFGLTEKDLVDIRVMMNRLDYVRGR